MKKTIFLLWACLLIGVCEAQKPYLAKFTMESCLHGNDSELELANMQIRPKNRIVSQHFVDNTLLLTTFSIASCSDEEGTVSFSDDTIRVNVVGNSYPIYALDSLGNVVEKGEDRNQSYCLCFVKSTFEIKNVPPKKYVIMGRTEILHQTFEPIHRVVSDKVKGKPERIFVKFSPADKDYIKPLERVNQFDAQGRRQGKFINEYLSDYNRYIVYFQDDLPTHRVKYKYTPNSPTEKADIKYFTPNCHKLVETTYYANGKKQEETFFDSQGNIFLRTWWDEAGKPIFLGK